MVDTLVGQLLDLDVALDPGVESENNVLRELAPALVFLFALTSGSPTVAASFLGHRGVTPMTLMLTLTLILTLP